MLHNDIWLCQMHLRGTSLFLYCLWYEHELWLPAFQFSLVSSFLLSGSLMLQLEFPVFKPISANHVNLRVSSFRNDAWFQSLVYWNKLDLRNESCQVLYQSSALSKYFLIYNSCFLMCNSVTQKCLISHGEQVKTSFSEIYYWIL